MYIKHKIYNITILTWIDKFRELEGRRPVGQKQQLK